MNTAPVPKTRCCMPWPAVGVLICQIVFLVFAMSCAADAQPAIQMLACVGQYWTSATGKARDETICPQRAWKFGQGGFRLAANSPSRKGGPLVIDSPWARATPGKTRNGAAYFTVVNLGRRADTLLSVSSSIARHASIHATINDKGIMRMRSVNGIDIPPGRSVMLKPGGYHVMLMGLSRPLVKGQEFKLKLNFKKSGPLTVTVKVLGMGAMGGDLGPHGMGDHAGRK